MAKPLIVVKRDGTTEEFSASKLSTSILNALRAAQVKNADQKTADAVAERVHVQAARVFISFTPRTQDVQDIVVDALEKAGRAKAAAAYVKMRQQRDQQQKLRTSLGVRDDLGLTQQAIAVLVHQYLMRGDEGRVVETPAQLCRRVAKAGANGARALEPASALKKREDEHYALLSRRIFLPGSPILMNAGINNMMLCNVMLPVQDSIEGIFRALADMAQLLRQGTVVSLWLGDLRPRGTLVKGTKGQSTGPLSFLQLFDHAADIVVQGSRRKTSCMAVLRCDHPDVEEFIALGQLQNFRRGVLVTDAFMKAAAEGRDWSLIDPLSNKPVRTVKAAELLGALISAARTQDDPAIIFVDDITDERVVGTTPCPSQPLLSFECVQQGVINLSSVVDRGHISWERLKAAVVGGIRFLDDAIEACTYTLPVVEQATKASRKIGLGVMGFADMLVQLGIVYGSKQSFDMADKVMKFISDEARKASVALGKVRGSYPSLGETTKPLRNAALITIMPVGALASVAGVSSGIEPLRSPVSRRPLNTLVVHPLFEALLRGKNAYSPAVMCKVAKLGIDIPPVPRDIKRLFVTSASLSTDSHLKMQAVFHKYADNGVGKALHLPLTATDNDVRKLVMAAHKLRLRTVWLHTPKDDNEPCRGCGV